MHAVVLNPKPGVPRRPFPLVFLCGAAQRADVWRSRMELLAAEGYECHALNFGQSGRYLTSYREQIGRMREYVYRRLLLFFAPFWLLAPGSLGSKNRNNESAYY